MALRLTLAVALLAVCCAGQQLAGNYVDDYDYQDGPPRQAARPQQRAPQPQRPLAASPLRQAAAPRPTPVPILKQINRHNEDGSYTYGYEGADGTFKIETKFPTGDVKGKYGFVDDTGKVRVVEYGADRYGFQPAGEGITVAPPTLVDETTRAEDLPEDDGYYQERPRPSRPQPQQQPRPRPAQPPPPPPPTRFQQDNYDVQTRFQSEPQYSPAPPSPRPKSPTPPRPLSIPGASPVPQGGGFSAPPRPRPQPQQAPRAFQPAQQFGPQHFNNRPAPQQPQHQPAQQPQFVHVPQNPQPQSSRSSGSGILDQLAKDYALPKGAGTPLHDISFGYY